MLTRATAANIVRKAEFIEPVQLFAGKPLFSWLELNVTELCNRSCVFCPRIDESVYPNQKLHMSLDLADKLATELAGLNWKGRVALCGYSEPLLHPDLPGLIQCFGSRGIRVELVTNGDTLSPTKLHELYDAGLSYTAVSLYDGPEQIDELSAIFETAGITEDRYVLRDRWHNSDIDYGLKLTNRAGTLDIGNQPAVDTTRPCWYLTYQIMVDWNGDVLLCPQDWHKRIKFGNLSHSRLTEIWLSSAMSKRRKQLLRGRAGLLPCSGCNAEGTVHGADHAAAWGAK